MKPYNIQSFVLNLIVFLLSLKGVSQTQIYEANYMFAHPKGSQVAGEEHFNRLEEIVKNTYTSKNLFSQQSPFVIVPSIKVISEKNAGEIQVVKVVKLEIGLTSQGTNDDFVFHNFKHILTITENNVESAITKAIELIAKEPKLKNFFAESNKKIVTFYQSNCTTILNTVQINIERKEYVKAFNFLKFVPESVSCYKESEKMITNIYSNTKEEHCKQLVQKAHGAEVTKNYAKALYYLKLVDPQANCYSSATEIVNKIGKSIDADIMREFEMEKLTFSKLTDLKKMEIIAKEVDFMKVTIN